MKIAIIAWGSLIWDRRELSILGEWQKGGPVLPIEFSRISSDGRLTLVIDDKNGVPVTTYYAQSASSDLLQAVGNLRKREGSPKEMIGVTSKTMNNRRLGYESIHAWATAHKWDAAIWTGLPSNFKEKHHIPFTVKNGLAYLETLGNGKRDAAIEYINKAPGEVDTPFRRGVVEKTGSR
jgi:hypothetical protein